MPRKAKAGQSWSFSWPCPNCKTTREFLVNEPVWQHESSLARCATCTRLIPVTDVHRGKMVNLRRHGLE